MIIKTERASVSCRAVRFLGRWTVSIDGDYRGVGCDKALDRAVTRACADAGFVAGKCAGTDKIEVGYDLASIHRQASEKLRERNHA